MSISPGAALARSLRLLPTRAANRREAGRRVDADTERREQDDTGCLVPIAVAAHVGEHGLHGSLDMNRRRSLVALRNSPIQHRQAMNLVDHSR